MEVRAIIQSGSNRFNLNSFCNSKIEGRIWLSRNRVRTLFLEMPIDMIWDWFAHGTAMVAITLQTWSLRDAINGKLNQQTRSYPKLTYIAVIS